MHEEPLGELISDRLLDDDPLGGDAVFFSARPAT
jgi:hypothetical protein